jgi:YebC/PmpR family DNA-binding regulatory protein
MSGHSKWSTIKRKKGAADAQRGRLFTKIAREIMVAAKSGGGDPSANPRLRLALAQARSANMPKDSQERAIKKGTGELEGVTFEESAYEGRGPHGSAFILEVLTDNKNRTVAELRHLLSKAGGELSSAGSVAWMFDRRGVIVLAHDSADEETLMERAIEAGADDIRDEEDGWVVLCDPSILSDVQAALEDLEPASAELGYLVKPESAISLEGDGAIAVAQLWAKLDEHEDVQKVFSNADLPDDVMEEHGP